MLKFFFFVITGLLLASCASISTIDKNAHPQVHRLQNALQKYNHLAAQPETIIHIQTPLKMGESNRAIPALKKRLITLGDYSKTCSTEHAYQFDICLHRAVRNFQSRHGLNSDGVLGNKTLQEINVPAQARVRAIQASMKKWAALPGVDAPPYIYINIPGYELKAMNKGATELAMRVVVGKPSWPTPEITSELKTVVLNPGWNVPVSITEKEIIHKIIENPNYLEEHNLRIIENWSKDAKEINPLSIDWKKYAGDKDLPYRLTQAPGGKNALGQIKFIFPNKEHIYLHDTPAKSLFNLSKRDLSHGCIRLQQPMRLLDYLSNTNPNLAANKVTNYLHSKKTKYLALNQNIPLYITYAPVWVDQHGKTQFRPDIYNKMAAPDSKRLITG